jgi:hypothetical protein
MSNSAAVKRDIRFLQWGAIDATRFRRAGSISRNSWITEAVLEKLERDQSSSERPQRAGGARA